MDESEVLIEVLGNRIENLERLLNDDEDFCNKDIDATYHAALKYLKSFEEKFHEKLNELRTKLDRIREENSNISKQNQQKFDEEIEEINQLYSSGKHQEALEKFQDYEKRFEQRTTIIQSIPKLYMHDIDINRYFSIDKPIIIPSNEDKQNSSDNIKPTNKTQNSSQKMLQTEFLNKEDDDENEQEFDKLPLPSVRPKRSENQPTITNNTPISKEAKSPSSNVSIRPLRFSTRLSSSPSSTSLSVSERSITTPVSVQSNHQNSRDNNTSNIQIRPAPSLPTVVSSVTQRRTTTSKTAKIDGFTTTYVAHYQHDRNTAFLMTCNKYYIILCRSQSDRLLRWGLSAIERYNLIEQDLDWNDSLISSIGFINQSNIYIFTKRDFIIYSLDSFSKINSWMISNDHDQNSEYNDLPCGIGTVYANYIYHISLNIESKWILSVFEFETKTFVNGYNLSEVFPDVQRFIHICVNEKLISFLVEMKGAQYAVLFCLNHNHLLFESNKMIQLFYAQNPLTICSICIHSLQKYLFFINDPSTKVIHILTNEKYLKSYALVAHTLCYIEESQELIVTSNDGIYAININEHENYLSKCFSN